MMRGRAPAWLGVGAAAMLVWTTAAGAQTQTVGMVAVGSVPRGVVVDTVANVALVGNLGESTLSLVDLATERVTATFQNISSPAGIALNRFTGVVVIANQFNNTITLFDLKTRRILGNPIPVGSGPVGVDINPNTNLAVVANSNGNSVSLVDLNLRREKAVVDGIPNATGLQSVAVDPDLNIAAVASSSTNSLFVVDLAQQKIRAQISVEQSPSSVAIEPVSKTAVVANLNSNSVSLIDLQAVMSGVSPEKTVKATVSGVQQPQAVAISTGTRSALVTTGVSATLEIVSLSAAAIANSITDLPSAAGVAVNENTGRAVVTLPNNNSLAIVRALGVFTMVNAATFVPGPVAPSSIASGFGSGLASQQASAGNVPLPTTLANVTVRVRSTPVPLFFVSRDQINFQVPRLSPGTYRVEVFNGTQRVASGALAVVSAAPGLFTANQQGADQAAALNENGIYNGAPTEEGSDQRPAARGSIIQMFGTGAGRTEPDPEPGSPSLEAAPTTLQPTATIGGLPATVLYSGASPGLVGVWQINLRVPATVRASPITPVVVTLGGRAGNTVTIAVE